MEEPVEEEPWCSSCSIVQSAPSVKWSPVKTQCYHHNFFSCINFDNHDPANRVTSDVELAIRDIEGPRLEEREKFKKASTGPLTAERRMSSKESCTQDVIFLKGHALLLAAFSPVLARRIEAMSPPADDGAVGDDFSRGELEHMIAGWKVRQRPKAVEVLTTPVVFNNIVSWMYGRPLALSRDEILEWPKKGCDFLDISREYGMDLFERALRGAIVDLAETASVDVAWSLLHVCAAYDLRPELEHCCAEVARSGGAGATEPVLRNLPLEGLTCLMQCKDWIVDDESQLMDILDQWLHLHDDAMWNDASDAPGAGDVLARPCARVATLPDDLACAAALVTGGGRSQEAFRAELLAVSATWDLRWGCLPHGKLKLLALRGLIPDSFVQDCVAWAQMVRDRQRERLLEQPKGAEGEKKAPDIKAKRRGSVLGDGAKSGRTRRRLQDAKEMDNKVDEMSAPREVTLRSASAKWRQQGEATKHPAAVQAFLKGAFGSEGDQQVRQAVALYNQCGDWKVVKSGLTKATDSDKISATEDCPFMAARRCFHVDFVRRCGAYQQPFEIHKRGRGQTQLRFRASGKESSGEGGSAQRRGSMSANDDHLVSLVGSRRFMTGRHSLLVRISLRPSLDKDNLGMLQKDLADDMNQGEGDRNVTPRFSTASTSARPPMPVAQPRFSMARPSLGGANGANGTNGRKSIMALASCMRFGVAIFSQGSRSSVPSLVRKESSVQPAKQKPMRTTPVKALGGLGEQDGRLKHAGDNDNDDQESEDDANVRPAEVARHNQGGSEAGPGPGAAENDDEPSKRIFLPEAAVGAGLAAGLATAMGSVVEIFLLLAVDVEQKSLSFVMEATSWDGDATIGPFFGSARRRFTRWGEEKLLKEDLQFASHVPSDRRLGFVLDIDPVGLAAALGRAGGVADIQTLPMAALKRSWWVDSMARSVDAIPHAAGPQPARRRRASESHTSSVEEV